MCSFVNDLKAIFVFSKYGMEELVILVDEQDNELGVMPKMEAHLKGVLHRAFSVFLFNDNGELLLQKRASSKYHSPSLWTNTCCSHPRKNETIIAAAQRRLQEEMGISADLSVQFSFKYKAELDQGLIEHELDHVLIGTFNGKPELNAEEAEDWKYISTAELTKEIQKHPNQFTEWFKICLEQTLNSKVNF